MRVGTLALGLERKLFSKLNPFLINHLEKKNALGIILFTILGLK